MMTQTTAPPLIDCGALLREGANIGYITEAQNRGLCLATEVQTPAPTTAPLNTTMSASGAGIGFPFPLLFVGAVAAVAAGLGKVRDRKYSRDFEAQKDSAYRAVFQFQDTANARIPAPDLTCPSIKDDGLPVWRDGIPKMVPTLPRSQRDTWEGEPMPWYGDTPATPGTTPGTTPSDTAPTDTSDTAKVDPIKCCPFDISQPPCEGEKRAVEWLLYLDKSQTEIITTVWGVSKNGRQGSPYQNARARYLGYLQAWKDRYGLD